MELPIINLKWKVHKCNIEKSFFAKTEMGYLGFLVTHNGVKPVDKKYKQLKYESNAFLKRSATVNRCSALLTQYVDRKFHIG